MTGKSDSDSLTGEEAPEPLVALARTVAAGTLAGFAVGVIAGGIGSRLAMRISAITAGDRFQGALTDFEARVGDITPGSIFLVLVGGATGAAGGIIYLILRPWLADAGYWRGLAFGAILLAMFGSAVIRGDNPDFHRFGPPALNITMFAGIFILYALLMVPLFHWIDRRLPAPSLRHARRAPLLANGFGLLLILVAIQGTPIVAEGDGLAIAPYVLLVMPVASSVISRRAGSFERLSDLRGRQALLGWALAILAAPVIVGVALDVRAVLEIYEANF